MDLYRSRLICAACFLTAVLASAYRLEERPTNTAEVPLMLEGAFATAEVLRSINHTTVYIAAFNQDLILDVTKTSKNSVLSSTVETFYKAVDQPFRRKTPYLDDCFYHGTVRGRRKSAVYLDACSQRIRGTVYTGKEKYVISPAWEDGYLYRVTRLRSVVHRRHETRQDPPATSTRHRQRRQSRPVNQSSGRTPGVSHLELYIVHDHQQFIDSGRNLEVLRNKSTTLAHLVGLIYADINIRVTLVGSEVWNEGNEIEVSSDGYTTLDNFLAWREDELLPRQSNDVAVLLSGTSFFYKNMKAYAYHGEMCSTSFSGAVLEDNEDDELLLAYDAAHSIGHTLGLRHDTPECACNDPTNHCVMDIGKRVPPPTKFSTCSRELLSSHISMGYFNCLNNLPSIPLGPLCGNGLLEAGEQCDCGEPQECKDVCCISTECQRTPDCARHSSQSLASAEVITAPMVALGLQGQDQQAGADVGSLPPQELPPPVPASSRIAEATEEQFNAISTGEVIQPGGGDDPQPGAFPNLELPGSEPLGAAAEDGDLYLQLIDEITRGVPATRAAMLESTVPRRPPTQQPHPTPAAATGNKTQLGTASIQKEALFLQANISSVTSGSNLNSPGGNTRLESHGSFNSTQACVDSSVGIPQGSVLLGDHASVSEIFERLGIEELDTQPTFIIQPDPEIYIVSGKPLNLNCEASGPPVMSYTWLKDGEEMDIQSDPRMIHHHGNLTIQFPDWGDVGTYQCLVSTIYTTVVSSKTSVMRAALGRFATSPGTLREVHVGDIVILACNPPLSVPPPLVSWALNSSGDPIRHSRRVSQDSKGNLVISAAEEQDTGLYHCIVVNEVMELKIESPRINLIVKQRSAPPAFVSTPEENQVGLQGEQVNFKCLAAGNPVPQIWWEREDAELPVNRSSHTSFGQELIITSLEVEDSGVYRCIVENGVGPRIEASVTLNVRAAPFWIMEPQSLTLPVGMSPIFTCQAGGDPAPVMEWYINNQPAEELSESLKLHITDGQLQMNETADVDRSMGVQCVASNQYGSIISNAHLLVLALAATFREAPPGEMVVLEGESIRLPCRALGAPKPTITWVGDENEEIVQTDRLRVQSDGSLTICNTTESDEGDYTCVVDNKYGYETKRTQLFVRRRTQFAASPSNVTVLVGGPVFLPCVVTPDPDLETTITWETPRHQRLMDGADGSIYIAMVTEDDEGMYTCVAQTDLDRVSTSAYVKVTEPPQLCGNGNLDPEEDCDPGPHNASSPDPCCGADCRWRPDIECREESACCNNCQLQPHTVLCEDIPEEHSECRLAAYCSGSLPECPAPLQMPDGSPCRNGGQCVDGECRPFCELYGLESCQCSEVGSSCLQCCLYNSECKPYSSSTSGSPTPLQDDLPCGDGGVCSQGVCTGEQTTPRPPTTTSKPLTTTLEPTTTPLVTTVTTASTAATTEAIIERMPNAPREVTLTSLSSPLDVQLSWSSDPEDHIEQFEVETQTPYSRNSWSMLTSVPGNQTTARVTLFPYISYQFRVTAVNGMGRSQPGETTGVYYTPPGRPISNPKNVTVVGKNGQLEVQWQPTRPEEHGAPFFSYTIRWRLLGSQTWQEKEVSMFHHSFIIPASSEDEAYQVMVQSINAVGPGPEPDIVTYVSELQLERIATTIPPKAYLVMIRRPPEMTRVLVGSRLSLPCEVDSYPEPRIEWYFNGQQVVEEDNREIEANGQLVIDPADLSNTGRYECRVMNFLAEQVEIVASEVSVLAPMLAFTIRPPPSSRAWVGDPVELPCVAEGFPQHSVVWRFQGNEIAYGANIYMAENKSIIIPEVDKTQQGLYQCIIFNGLHNVKMADSELLVREPLDVSTTVTGAFATPGSNISLPCQIITDMPLEASYWTRNGEIVYFNNLYQTSTDFSIPIPIVTREDGGNYTCVAETALSVKNVSMQLLVQTLPDAPSGVTTYPVEPPTKRGVSFDAPFDGNSPISAYLLEYSSPEAEVPWKVAKNITGGDGRGLDTEITVPPFYGFYVRVRAVNEFGLSEPSETAGPFHLPSTPPLKNPAVIRANVSDDGRQINISWEPLKKSELNGPGFYYIVEWSGANQLTTEMQTLVDYRQMAATLDADPELMPYDIRIQAGNELGLAPMPETLTVGIERKGWAIPNAPVLRGVDIISSMSINVTWYPVPPRPSYGNIYGYTVIVQPIDGSQLMRPLDCLSTVTHCEIDGVHGGSRYRVTVRASGDGGQGYSSLPMDVLIPADLPSVVTKMKVRAWSRTMLIKWNQPDSGDVEGYVVMYKESNTEGPAMEELVAVSPELSLKIGGLTPGTRYDVSVAAYNEAGRGESQSVFLTTRLLKTKRSRV
ncbi:uncharacterized protein [Diadema antillarum]|uniref:uncharacterized protein n=1 Tax=Diadema antillarum TaxID=105358 RepID=UPI003A8A492C